MIILDCEGEVVRCDESFISLVLGYSTNQLLGNKIETIIPGFYDEFEVPSCDKTDDDLGCLDPTLDLVSRPPRPQTSNS